jgi:hypothetical protein
MKKISIIIYGLIIGICLFFLAFGFESLNVQNDEWLISGLIEVDSILDYAGWIFFRNSQWSLPLKIDNLNFPMGIPLSYIATAGPSLFYFLSKLISDFLPATFQFFGILVLLAFILQAISSLFLLTLFIKDKVSLLFSSILFCLSPPMLGKAFKHVALTNHWLIIMAIYLYFKTRKTKEYFPWLFVLILPLSLIIHAYFFPMILVFFIISAIDYFIKTRNLKPIFWSFIITAILSVLLGYIFGLFGAGMSGVSFGFGYFSMNLSSFFNAFDNYEVSWSWFLPSFGRIEAFPYLGLGVIFLLFLFLSNLIKKLILEKNFESIKSKSSAFINRNILLIVICLFFYFWASFDDLFLIYNVFPQCLENILNIFRSSSRFIWPVFYLIYLFLIYWVVKKFSLNKMRLILIFVILIQFIDMIPGLITTRKYLLGNYSSNIPENLEIKNQRIKQNFKKVKKRKMIEGRIWKFVADNYKKILVVNKIGSFDLFLYLAKNDLATNLIMGPDVYKENSSEHLRCSGVLEDLNNGNIDSEAVYLTTDELIFQNLKMARSNDFYFFETNFPYYDHYIFLNPEGTFKLIIPKKISLPEDLSEVNYWKN